MKLKRVRNLPPVKISGRIPGELHEVLTAYTGYYPEEHGEAIAVWPLLMQMVRTFVDTIARSRHGDDACSIQDIRPLI